MMGFVNSLVKLVGRGPRASVKLFRVTRTCVVVVGCSMKPVMGFVSRVLLKWPLPFMLWPCIFWVPGFIVGYLLDFRFNQPCYLLGIDVEPIIQPLCFCAYLMPMTIPVGASGLLIGSMSHVAHLMLPSTSSDSDEPLPLVTNLHG